MGVKYLCWTLRLAVLLALPVSGTGCSWIFSQPPKYTRYRGDPVNCSTNRAPPVLDTLFTLTNVASAIYVAGQDNVVNKGTAVMAGLGVATLWGLSAAYGYRSASECEEALEPSSGSHYPPPRPRAMPPGYAPPRYAPPPPPPAPAPLAPTAPLPPPAPNDQGFYVVPDAAGGGTPPAPPPAPQQNDDDTPGVRRPQPPVYDPLKGPKRLPE